jgi:hypothetical protein
MLFFFKINIKQKILIYFNKIFKKKKKNFKKKKKKFKHKIVNIKN